MHSLHCTCIQYPKSVTFAWVTSIYWPKVCGIALKFTCYIFRNPFLYLIQFNVWPFNTLRPRQNGCQFPDDIFKCIFVNENVWLSIKISLKFVPKGSINNIPSLVQIMAWHRPGDKPLFEPMMVSLRTHICVTRPQWVKVKSKWSSNQGNQIGPWSGAEMEMLSLIVRHNCIILQPRFCTDLLK